MPKHVDLKPLLSRRDLVCASSKDTNGTTEVLLFVLLALSGALGFLFQDARLSVAAFCGGLAIYVAQRASANKGQGKPTQPSSAGEAGDKAASPTPAVQLPTAESALALIKARRSVFPKDYTGQRLSKQQVEMLLEAANWAPTHNLTQPWRFVVLEGHSKEQFEQLTIELVEKYTQPREKAAEAVERLRGKAATAWPMVSHYLAIVMSPVPSKTGKANPEWEDLASVSCAVQNIALLATAMGISGYWTSWQEVARDADEMKQFLGISKPQDRCLGLYCLGMSQRAGAYRGSRGPMSDKVQWRA